MLKGFAQKVQEDNTIMEVRNESNKNWKERKEAASEDEESKQTRKYKI